MGTQLKGQIHSAHLQAQVAFQEAEVAKQELGRCFGSLSELQQQVAALLSEGSSGLDPTALNDAVAKVVTSVEAAGQATHNSASMALAVQESLSVGEHRPVVDLTAALQASEQRAKELHEQLVSAQACFSLVSPLPICLSLR